MALVLGVVVLVMLARDIGPSNQFPAARHGETTVRIFAGTILDGKDGMSYGGNTPDVTLYDDSGHLWGQVKGSGRIGRGGFKDLVIPSRDGHNNRPTYIALNAAGNNDALCIAGFTVTHPDSHVDVITGDAAEFCGYAAMLSATALGNDRPKCMWIDGDWQYPGFHQGLSFHLPDFEGSKARASQYNGISPTLCDSEPRMHTHHTFGINNKIRIFSPPLRLMTSDFQVDFDFEPLWDEKYQKYSDDISRVKKRWDRMTEHVKKITEFVSRAFTPRSAAPTWEERFGRRVIKSNSTSHSADRMCKSSHFIGPDFVSLQEQLYCDMKSRQLYPVCSGSDDGSCFDLEANVLRAQNETMSPDGTAMLFTADRQAPARSYEFVEEW